MIKSFADKETAALFRRLPVRKFRGAWIEIARKKLEQINSANHVDFLKLPAGNRFELLKGDRKGQWSIRINKQYRICFWFENGNAYDVEIVDYH